MPSCFSLSLILSTFGSALPPPSSILCISLKWMEGTFLKNIPIQTPIKHSKNGDKH
ncbi:putative signal peptide protein [Puccinia sorghi]|uniref:Putative signal peptide protein n=1 Tax=Puccinia sorghi TaxID=27349 RepID=A0A0L6ULR2_9BASI|nr:putative signal peptide protein [Puccinia sorghi]